MVAVASHDIMDHIARLHITSAIFSTFLGMLAGPAARYHSNFAIPSMPSQQVPHYPHAPSRKFNEKVISKQLDLVVKYHTLELK